MEKGDVEEPKFVKIPLWHLNIRSKVTKRNDRLLLSMLVPGAVAYVIVYFSWYYYLRNSENIYIANSGFPIFILSFIVLFYLIWKLYITQNAKYDREDLFAYFCGSIGIELSELSVLPTYNHYLGPNTTALKRSIKFLRRKYEQDEELVESLNKFLKNLDNISLWLKEPEKHSKDFSGLSSNFLTLGQYVSGHHRTRIDVNSVKNIIAILEGITGKKTLGTLYEFFKKALTRKRIVTIIIDSILTAGTYFAFVNIAGQAGALALAGLVLFEFPRLIKDL